MTAVSFIRDVWEKVVKCISMLHWLLADKIHSLISQTPCLIKRISSSSKVCLTHPYIVHTLSQLFHTEWSKTWGEFNKKSKYNYDVSLSLSYLNLSVVASSSTQDADFSSPRWDCYVIAQSHRSCENPAVLQGESLPTPEGNILLRRAPLSSHLATSQCWVFRAQGGALETSAKSVMGGKGWQCQTILLWCLRWPVQWIY